MKILLVLFLTIISKQLKAQNFDLEKVTKVQLEQKLHPKDTSAPAAFLFKKAHTIFKYNIKDGFVSLTEITIKLKIYKKEGLPYATFEIPYYVGYENIQDESVTFLKAFTYNFSNGIIKKEKVTDEGKFKERVNDLWKTKTITFPNVKVGSILELKYQLKTYNLSGLPVFQFQYKIPVDYAQFITEIPEFYIYKSMKTGFIDVDFTEIIENASQIYEDKYGASNLMSYKQIRATYNANNVPALIEEAYINDINNYYGKIENELQIIRFPDEKPKPIASTWDDVAKSVYNEKDFGAELDKYQYFINDLKLLIGKLDAKQEIARAVFEFVKNRMAWNGKYGYYTKKGVELAYKEKTGNVAEINFILTAMLRMSGLDANPVLISTKDNGIALFPNRSKLNYVITAVVIDGKRVLLDATDKFCNMKNLPIRDLNSKGRVINKTGNCVEVDLIPNYTSATVNTLFVDIDSKGVISGKVRKQYLDYNALQFRNYYSGIAKEICIENIEKKYTGLEIGDYELENDKLIDKPVIESYTIKNQNVVEIIGDKMFFSPMLYLAITKNPFKQEERKYPVDFPFPLKDKYVISINIPESYEVATLPKNSSMTIEEKQVSFSYQISKNERLVTLVFNYDINYATISAEYYNSLKELFKMMIEKQNEKIVLKRI
jgi:hypothetical protein